MKEVSFEARIYKYSQQKEKTGWTYIDIPVDIAIQLHKANKKAFRVKGKLDNTIISGVALIPVGDGNYILPLNADLRRSIAKREGGNIKVSIMADNEPLKIYSDLVLCLISEPDANSFFNTLSPSHQMYFSKWISSAKTSATREKRIIKVIKALLRRMDYGSMLREKEH